MITIINLNKLRFGNMLFVISAVISTSVKYNIPYVIPEWEYADLFDFKFEQMDENSIRDKIKQYFNEIGFNFNAIPTPSEFTSLMGYYQSEKYFDNISAIKLFAFKKEIINPILEKHNELLNYNTCAIHVRHGDIFDRLNGGGFIAE